MAETKSEVAGKTTPNLRDETATDNSRTFEKDYTARLDDSGQVPQHVKDQQLVDMRQSALQRGLIPTGDAKLAKTDKVDDRNVRLIYTLPVKLNGERVTERRVAAAKQPADTDTKPLTDEPSKEA